MANTLMGLPVFEPKDEKDTIEGLPIFKPDEDRHEKIVEDILNSFPEKAREIADAEQPSRKYFKDIPERLSKSDREAIQRKLRNRLVADEDLMATPFDVVGEMPIEQRRGLARERQAELMAMTPESEEEKIAGGLRSAYLTSKGALSGMTFGFSDYALNQIEEMALGDRVKAQSMMDKLGEGVGNLIGMVAGVSKLGTGLSNLGKVVRNYKSIKNAKGISNFLNNEAVKALTLRAMTPLVSSTVKGVNQMIQSGDVDRPEAWRNLSKNVGYTVAGSMFSMLPEQLLPKGWLNFTGQVVGDLFYDLTTDIYMRDRLKDQSFTEWLITEELPQIALSIGMAGRDLTDPNFKPMLEPKFRKILRDISDKVKKDVRTDFDAGVKETRPAFEAQPKRELADIDRRIDELKRDVEKPENRAELRDLMERRSQIEEVAKYRVAEPEDAVTEGQKALERESERVVEPEPKEVRDAEEIDAVREEGEEVKPEREPVGGVREEYGPEATPAKEGVEPPPLPRKEPPPLPERTPLREFMPEEIGMARAKVSELEPFIGEFVEPHQKWTMEELAAKAIKEGHVSNAKENARKVLANPRALRKEEAMGLTLRAAEIAKERDEQLRRYMIANEVGDKDAKKTADAQMKALDEELAMISNAAKLQASEAGSSAKVIDNIIKKSEFDLDNIVKKYEVALGREATDTEKAELKKQVDKIKKLDKEKERIEHEVKIAEEMAIKDTEITKEELERAKAIKDKDAEIAKEIAKLEKIFGKLVDITYTPVQAAKAAPIIRKIIALKMAKRGLTVEQAVEDALLSMPKMSKLDMYSLINYKKPVMLNKKVAEQREIQREMGAQARLLEKMERALSREFADVDETPTRRVKSAEVQRLEKLLSEIEPPESRDAKKIDAWIKKRDELLDQLDAQYRLLPKRGAVEESEELRAIKEKVKALMAERRAFDTMAKLEEELRTGKKFVGVKTKNGVQTDAYKAWRKRIRELRQRIAKQKRLDKLDKQIASALEGKLEPPKPTKKRERTPEELKKLDLLKQIRKFVEQPLWDKATKENLERKYRELEANYNNLVRSYKEKDKPMPSDEILKLKDKIAELRRAARIDAQVMDINERVARGEFQDTTKKQRYRYKSDLLLKKETELIGAKRELAKKMHEAELKSGRVGAVTKELLNFQREAKTMSDISAAGRQMRQLGMLYPKEYAKALDLMLRNMWSQEKTNEMMASIHQHPNYPRAAQYVEEMDYGKMGESGTEFFDSALMEKIPIMRNIANVSGRAFVDGINALRFGVMFKFMDDLEKMTTRDGFFTGKRKLTQAEKEKALEDMGKLINIITGSGTVSKDLRKYASWVEFAPRFMWSKPEFLYRTIMPARAGGWRSKQVRMKALKSLALEAATWSTLLGLADYFGWEVELDPESSDFLKIKDPIFGRRWDVMNGYQQPIRLALRSMIALGNAIGGEPELNKKRYWDIISDYLFYKSAPWIGTAHSFLTGKNIVGERRTKTETAIRAFTPIPMETTADELADFVPLDSAIREYWTLPEPDREAAKWKIGAILSELTGLFSSQKYDDKERKRGRKRKISTYVPYKEPDWD